MCGSAAADAFTGSLTRGTLPTQGGVGLGSGPAAAYDEHTLAPPYDEHTLAPPLSGARRATTLTTTPAAGVTDEGGGGGRNVRTDRSGETLALSQKSPPGSAGDPLR
jgi:hypothetical protein